MDKKSRTGLIEAAPEFSRTWQNWVSLKPESELKTEPEIYSGRPHDFYHP
jgi:hypothetical protein